MSQPTHPAHPPAGLPWLSLVLVALAAGAAGALLANLATLRDSATPALDSPRSDPVALTRLTERVVEIERRLAGPPPAQARVEPREPAAELQAVLDPEALSALQQRLAALERALAARPQPSDAAAAPPIPRPAPDPAEIMRQLAANQQRILHPTTTPEQKLESWRNLRNNPDAYSDAVVQQMVALGLSVPDPKYRADVWRQADSRSKHPALAVALVRALQSDTDADVREEAAETLEIYSDRPDVVQALTAARDSDASEKVRQFAARSLDRAQRGRR